MIGMEARSRVHVVGFSVAVGWSSDKAHRFQEGSRSLDAFLIRILQSVNVQTVEVTEHTMQPIALFELLIHR